MERREGVVAVGGEVGDVAVEVLWPRCAAGAVAVAVRAGRGAVFGGSAVLLVGGQRAPLGGAEEGGAGLAGLLADRIWAQSAGRMSALLLHAADLCAEPLFEAKPAAFEALQQVVTAFVLQGRE